MILANTTKQPVKIMSRDKKSVSRTTHIRRGIANQQPSGKATQNYPSNMVSTRKLREMQKKADADKGEEAKTAEGAQGGQSTTAVMTDAIEDMYMLIQGETVGSKRKHNEPTIAVNNQTGIDLTTATHMDAVGTQIPTMGADANTQQVLPVANMLTAQTEVDSLAAESVHRTGSRSSTRSPTPTKGRGKQCGKWLRCHHT
jgi:hypothetical protein